MPNITLLHANGLSTWYWRPILLLQLFNSLAWHLLMTNPPDMALKTSLKVVGQRFFNQILQEFIQAFCWWNSVWKPLSTFKPCRNGRQQSRTKLHSQMEGSYAGSQVVPVPSNMMGFIGWGMSFPMTHHQLFLKILFSLTPHLTQLTRTMNQKMMSLITVVGLWTWLYYWELIDTVNPLVTAPANIVPWGMMMYSQLKQWFSFTKFADIAPIAAQGIS